MTTGTKVARTYTLMGATRDGRRFRLTPGGDPLGLLARQAVEINRQIRNTEVWHHFYVNSDAAVEAENYPVAHVILPGDTFPSQESVRTVLETYGQISVKKGGHYTITETGETVRGMNGVLSYFDIKRLSTKLFEANRFITSGV